MNKIELLRIMECIPDDAKVFIESDHGQTPCIVCGVVVTQDDVDDYFNPEEAHWRKITHKTNTERITAILLL